MGSLGQGLANFFCKEPDSKYFRIVKPMVSAATTQLCHCRLRAGTDNTQNNYAP